MVAAPFNQLSLNKSYVGPIYGGIKPAFATGMPLVNKAGGFQLTQGIGAPVFNSPFGHYNTLQSNSF